MQGRIAACLAALAAWGTSAVEAAGRSGALLAQAQQAGGGVTTQTTGKSYVVESLVTVALFGLALWVVCKSSRRV